MSFQANLFVSILLFLIASCGSDSTNEASPEISNVQYFVADDGVHGSELWKSDGTEAGTVMVKDIIPGANDGEIDEFGIKVVGNTIFFRADFNHDRDIELWKSDGTEVGTVMVKDMSIGQIFVVNNTLYFEGSDGVNEGLWKSDGTEVGTVMVKAFKISSSMDAVAIGNILYFNADDGLHGEELWKTDGTEAGTVMVKDINPAGNGAAGSSFVVVNSTLYFAANDGTHGEELWKSDGTEAGTVMVKDISASDPDVRNLTVGGSTLYFTTDDGVHGAELWKSDGTEAGTVMIKDINPGASSSSINLVRAVGDTIYFRVDSNGDLTPELWKSDGSEIGTVMVKDVSPSYLTAIGSTLYFSADDGVHGGELWKSDGTESGTVMIKDIRSGGSSHPVTLGVVNGELFFSADDGVHGGELWKSDGTDSGTVMIKDINLSGSSMGPS